MSSDNNHNNPTIDPLKDLSVAPITFSVIQDMIEKDKSEKEKTDAIKKALCPLNGTMSQSQILKEIVGKYLNDTNPLDPDKDREAIINTEMRIKLFAREQHKVSKALREFDDETLRLIRIEEDKIRNSRANQRDFLKIAISNVKRDEDLLILARRIKVLRPWVWEHGEKVQLWDCSLKVPRRITKNGLGYVEIWTEYSEYPENQKNCIPQIGEQVVRLLNKNGSPSKHFERIRDLVGFYSYSNTYWFPIGIQALEVKEKMNELIKAKTELLGKLDALRKEAWERWEKMIEEERSLIDYNDKH